MSKKSEFIEVDLLQLFRAIWHRAWLVILVMLITGALAFSVTTFFITPMYKARTLVYVNNSSGPTEDISSSDLNAAKSLVDTYSVILKTRETLEDVIAQAGLPYTYGKLNKMVDAASVNSTEIFYIQATSPDPEEAKLIANTIGEILPRKIAAVMEGTTMRIVDEAIAPSKPSSPNVPLNTLLGCIIGFILSCSAIVIHELTDQQIHDPDYLTKTYDLPILASIPDLFDNTKRQANNHTLGGTK